MADDRKKGDYARASKGLADGLARICRLYGVSPLLGRLYVALFLSLDPKTLEELADAAGVAKSSASVALRKLHAAGLVLRTAPRGDRRDYYEVVSDPFAVLDHWRRHYFEPEAEMWRATGDALGEALEGAADAPPEAEKAVVAARIARMGEFLGIFDGMMSTVDAGRAPKRARAIPVKLDDEEPT